MAVDFERRVNQYVQMRDKIKELDDAHKEKMAPFRETWSAIEMIFSNTFI